MFHSGWQKAFLDHSEAKIKYQSNFLGASNHRQNLHSLQDRRCGGRMFNCSPVWKYLLSGLGWAAAPAGGGLFVLLSPTRQDGISRLDIDIYTGPHQRGVFRLGKLGNMMILQLYLLEYPDIYCWTGCRYEIIMRFLLYPWSLYLCTPRPGHWWSAGLWCSNGDRWCPLHDGSGDGHRPHPWLHNTATIIIYTSCDTTQGGQNH